jgi:CheY-like chemotaxis protein
MARRILVVEDDERSRRLLRDVLTYHGYAVEEAQTGEEALRAARLALPDAALLDIQLPGLNGFELLAALRGLPGADFPVLAVTASVMDHDRKRILAAGFDAYVAKPVNIRQLLGILKDRLDKVSP